MFAEFNLQEQTTDDVVHINIVGVGGGGTNSVERMLDANIPMVKYITINTDDGGYLCSRAETKIQIGRKETKGRGALIPKKGSCLPKKKRLKLNKLYQVARWYLSQHEWAEELEREPLLLLQKSHRNLAY